MSWFGYDQGVFSGVLISADFKNYFPETKQANISGITSSCFSVRGISRSEENSRGNPVLLMVCLARCLLRRHLRLHPG